MKLKILVVISLLIFWSVFTAIVVAGLLSKNATQQTTSNKQLVPDLNGQSQITLSATEVAKHGTTSDCWLIISNKVYDVSGYLRAHPGGSSTITPYCGKDGTIAFETKDLNRSRDHSSYAYNLLQDYYLGDLNQVLNNSVSAASIPTSKVLPTPTTAAPVGQTSISLTLVEVAKHNTSSDCWMIISNNVYNFTSYLRAHPGGVLIMTPYCGKDGTQVFANRGGTGSHSSFAYSLLANYLVGTLNQSVGTTTIQNTQTVTPSVSQRRRGDD